MSEATQKVELEWNFLRDRLKKKYGFLPKSTDTQFSSLADELTEIAKKTNIKFDRKKDLTGRLKNFILGIVDRPNETIVDLLYLNIFETSRKEFWENKVNVNEYTFYKENNLDIYSVAKLREQLTVAENTIAGVQTQYQTELQVADLNERHDLEIGALKKVHQEAENQLVADLNKKYDLQIKALKKERQDAENQLVTKYDLQLEALKKQHDLQIENLKEARQNAESQWITKYDLQIEALKKDHDLEIEKLNEARQNAESQWITKYDLQIEALNKKHDLQIENLNEARQNAESQWITKYDLQIEALKKQHNLQLGELKKTHQDSENQLVANLTKKYNLQLGELKKVHQGNENQLVTKYDLQIADLNEKHNLQIGDFKKKQQDYETQSVAKYDLQIAKLNERHDLQIKSLKKERQDAENQLVTKYDLQIADLNKKYNLQIGELKKAHQDAENQLVAKQDSQIETLNSNHQDIENQLVARIKSLNLQIGGLNDSLEKIQAENNKFKRLNKKQKCGLMILVPLAVLGLGFLSYKWNQYNTLKNEYDTIKKDLFLLPHKPTEAEIAKIEGIWECQIGSTLARLSDNSKNLQGKFAKNIADFKYHRLKDSIGYFTIERYGPTKVFKGYAQFISKNLLSIHYDQVGDKDKVSQHKMRHSLMRLDTKDSASTTAHFVMSVSWEYGKEAIDDILGIREVYIKRCEGHFVGEVYNNDADELQQATSCSGKDSIFTIKYVPLTNAFDPSLVGYNSFLRRNPKITPQMRQDSFDKHQKRNK